MDDFYVYYMTDDANPKVGLIKAIAPIELPDDMGDMPYIRVPAEQGMQFTVGTESISKWLIQWDESAGTMALVKMKTAIGSLATAIIAQMPTKMRKPEITVQYKKRPKGFKVTARGVGLGQPNMQMRFFVTAADDPNIFYHHFPVDLFKAMTDDGEFVPYKGALPEKFSVYTRFFFDRYLLRLPK